jgi:copper transport protein
VTPTRRLLAVGALVAVLLVAGSTPAWAHATLEGTDPAAGATVVRSPDAVTLTFSEDVQVALGGVRAFDSRGHRVDLGAPGHPGGEGTKVRASVPQLRDGTYVVTWRVTSADSHPIRGAFTFSVGTASASSGEAQSLAARLLTDQGGSTVVGAGMAVARLGVFLGITVLIGAAAFLTFVWRAGREDRTARRVVWTVWGIALGATLLGFLLQGPYVAGEGLVKAFDPSLWSAVWGTRFGRVWIGRAVLLLLAVPLLRMLMPRGPVAEHPLPAWWPGAAGLLAVALAATPAFAGHPVTGRWVALAVPVDALHVASVGLWLGGLVMLGVTMRRRDDEDTLRVVVPRYSGYALVAVVLIVATGAFQMVRQVTELSAFTDTDYGRLLSIKLLVFVGLLAVAAFSRDVVNRRWRLPLEVVHAPAVTVAGGHGLALADPALAEEYPDGYVLDEPNAERRLRRSVAVELVISVVILAVTALLVDAAPPIDTATGPYIATLNAGSVKIDTVLTPARRGPNELHLTALTAGGGIQDTVDMTAELSQPANDIAPIEVPLIRAGPGHYLSNSFVVPFAGTWQLTVKALITDVDEVTATADVPIR